MKPETLCSLLLTSSSKNHTFRDDFTAQVALDLLDHPSSSTPFARRRDRSLGRLSCPLLRRDRVAQRRIAGREANPEVPGALKDSPDFCGSFGMFLLCFVWSSRVLWMNPLGLGDLESSCSHSFS